METSYKKILCSFGDSRMHKTLERLQKQAEEMNFYDEIHICDETNLDKEFRERFKKQLVFGSRGYGYWCWKPQIVKQFLEQMNEGDIINYIDAGCHLNKNGIKRLNEYFEITNNSKSGILAFRSFWDNTYPFKEYIYNKADLLNYFGVLDDKEITHTGQFEAGIFFMRKQPNTMQFIDNWIEVFHKDFSLIDDSKSKIPNLEGFFDHRHDLSIYSILCKKEGVEELFTSEYIHTDWSSPEMAFQPILAKRDRQLPFTDKLRKAIYRRLIMLKNGTLTIKNLLPIKFFGPAKD